MKKDTMGDYLKAFEKAEAGRTLMPFLPVVARIDGKTFHTYTKGLERPYDERLSRAMVETTKFLVERTNALIGYTQSDEITLLWYPEENTDFIFSGRTQKLTSILASMATAKFNDEVKKTIEEKKDDFAFFDCRVWAVPTKEIALQNLIWREDDATKNSISMAASAYYHHNILEGKKGSEKQEMLFQKGINWNNYPNFFKRGTYVRKEEMEVYLTDEELEKIPEKHRPQGAVMRSKMLELDLPPIRKIENLEEFVFDKAAPVKKAEVKNKM